MEHPILLSDAATAAIALPVATFRDYAHPTLNLLLLTFLLLYPLLHQLQFSRALARRNNIFSHHILSLAILLALPAVFIHTALFTLDAACGPVMAWEQGLYAAAVSLLFVVHGLRGFHAHVNAMWVLAVAVVIQCLLGAASWFVAHESHAIILAEGVCTLHTSSSALRVQNIVYGVVVALTLLVLATAKDKSSWRTHQLGLLGFLVVYDVTTALWHGPERYLGVFYITFIRFVVMAGVTVSMIQAVEQTRQENLTVAGILSHGNGNPAYSYGAT